MTVAIGGVTPLQDQRQAQYREEQAFVTGQRHKEVDQASRTWMERRDQMGEEDRSSLDLLQAGQVTGEKDALMLESLQATRTRAVCHEASPRERPREDTLKSNRTNEMTDLRHAHGARRLTRVACYSSIHRVPAIIQT
jgi:hypothetical protein